MDALRFEEPRPSTARAPVRADVALFVGRGRGRETARGAPPAGLERWFVERGWLSGNRVHPRVGRAPAELDALRDVPVPVESFEEFERLFETDRAVQDAELARAALHGRRVETWLAGAVRAFFAAGGRRAIVVATRPPDPYLGWTEPAGADSIPREREDDARIRDIADIVPGLRGSRRAEPGDASTWRGIGHLFGLEEVSFLSLPDLAELVAPPALPSPGIVEPPGAPEVFVPCSTPAGSSEERRFRDLLRAPRLDEPAYARWAEVVRHVALMLADARNGLRGVQLVAAVPLARDEGAAGVDLSLSAHLSSLIDEPGGLGTAFLQLVHPWVRSDGAQRSAEGLENPEGRVIGVLARSARTRGAWRSAGGLPVPGVFGGHPLLRASDLGFSDAQRPGPPRELTVRERFTLVHRSPAGWTLASDVTASLDERYRPAAVNRLVSLLVRALRAAGESAAFEPAGEDLFARLRRQSAGVLDLFRADGALLGDPGYRVRCDRTTTTQADLDAGRVVVEVEFDAAVPIERLTVALQPQGGAAVRVA